MNRKRQFSETEVLNSLTDAFITHGYAGASLAVLQDATGLGRQSLYNTFGDKQSMYLEAVDCVMQRVVPIAAAVQAAPTGRAAVGRYYAAVLELCSSTDPAQQNCIITSGLLEGIDASPLQSTLGTCWQKTHELLRAELERGQRDGSIVNATPSAELAELLMSLTSGLRVAARAGRSKAQMEKLVALTLSILDKV